METASRLACSVLSGPCIQGARASYPPVRLAWRRAEVNWQHTAPAAKMAAMIHNYDEYQAVRPASADEVTVTGDDGGAVTLTTPIAVASDGKVSFAIDDGGANLRILVRVDKPGGGLSSVDRVMLVHPLSSGGFAGLDPTGTTDCTALIQAALDAAAASNPRSVSNPNDRPGNVVELPAGRFKITQLEIGANTWLRGAGPSTTYLCPTEDMSAIVLKNDDAVQITVSDLGIIGNNAGTVQHGIDFSMWGGGASILGDARMVFRDLMIVEPAIGINHGEYTEMRMDRVTVQRSTDVSFQLNGATDSFISECTSGGQSGGAVAFDISGANNMVANCKAFGFAGVYAAFYVNGAGRHSLTGCQAQDCAGDGFRSLTGDPSVLADCIADSCQTNGFYMPGGSVTVLDGCVTVVRSGGLYSGMTPFAIDQGTWGRLVNCLSKGSTTTIGGTANPNLDGWTVDAWPRGGQSVNYAASITPVPNSGEKIYLGTLTGNLSIANPVSPPYFMRGQRMSFVLTQDATGGRTVTFGNAFKTASAVSTGANTTTYITFECDGTNQVWREVGRTVTT